MMMKNSIKSLVLICTLALQALACSTEGSAGQGNGTIDVDFRAMVAVDFNAMEGDVEAATQPGDIVYDLRKSSTYGDIVQRLRCVGLDPFASELRITRLDAEGLESFLDFSIEIAPYPAGEWTPLANFTSLVSDQSKHAFDAPGFTIYYEGLDVLESIAFDALPQFELRVTSVVPNAIMALEVELDLAMMFSSESNQCPGPPN